MDFVFPMSESANHSRQNVVSATALRMHTHTAREQVYSVGNKALLDVKPDMLLYSRAVAHCSRRVPGDDLVFGYLNGFPVAEDVRFRGVSKEAVTYSQESKGGLRRQKQIGMAISGPVTVQLPRALPRGVRTAPGQLLIFTMPKVSPDQRSFGSKLLTPDLHLISHRRAGSWFPKQQLREWLQEWRDAGSPLQRGGGWDLQSIQQDLMQFRVPMLELGMLKLRFLRFCSLDANGSYVREHEKEKRAQILQKFADLLHVPPGCIIGRTTSAVRPSRNSVDVLLGLVY